MNKNLKFDTNSFKDLLYMFIRTLSPFVYLHDFWTTPVFAREVIQNSSSSRPIVSPFWCHIHLKKVTVPCTVLWNTTQAINLCNDMQKKKTTKREVNLLPKLIYHSV